VTELCKHIDKVSKVEIFTTIPNRYSSYDVKEKDKIINNKIDIHRIYVPSHNSSFLGQAIAFLFFAFGVLVKSKNRDWDIIVCTSSRLMSAFLGALIAKKKKIKLFLDIRDLFVDTISNILSKSFFKKFLFLLKYIENWTFSKAHQINLVSYGFHDYIYGNFNNISISFYTNGIDDIFTRVKAYKIKKKFPHKINILYAGNIGSGQALHKILPKFALDYPNLISFTVIGDGSKKHELQDLIEKKKIQNIKILKPVKRTKLNDFYKKADLLFLHLDDNEAFKKVLPSKIFEYACLGKPILAGVDGYASKFFKEEIIGCYIFKPCDQSSLKNVFIKSISNETSFDRTLFIKKYKRTNIMKKMANDIIKSFSK